VARGNGSTDSAQAHCRRLGLPALTPERGFVTLVQADGHTLVTPGQWSKRQRADWAETELPYRSVVFGPDGNVVSAALPKFFNKGEAPDVAARLDAALAAGEPVWFTEKLDGSLAIRYVEDGVVRFRTRGSFDGGDFGDAIRRLAAARYPALLDPSLEPGRSLLFEFVSPDFRIVMGYEREDLVLVGAVSNADFRLADLPELRQIADENALTIVPTVELPRDPAALAAAVTAFTESEGIVVRFEDGQTLVKMKSARYLALHRLRTTLTVKKLRSLCLTHDVRDLDAFAVALQAEVDRENEERERDAIVLDWEALTAVRPIAERIIAARAQGGRDLAELESIVAPEIAAAPDRKSFALGYARTLPAPSRAAAFMLVDGNRAGALAFMEELALDRALTFAELADELDLDA